MRAVAKATFVISWAQTALDGLRGAPQSALRDGAFWRWRGRAERLDGCGDLLTLDAPLGHDILHAHAASAVRRIYGRALPPMRVQVGSEIEDPLLTRMATFSDGVRYWTATLIDVVELARPLMVFHGAMPPPDTDLRVVASPEIAGRPVRISDTPSSVICFTHDTLLDTPSGPRRIDDLAEGDAVLTRDNGAQEIVWIGQRHMSGARLHAMPDHRPVRIRGGAMGGDGPSEDLLVSPRHRILMSGAPARALFGTDEVLVAAEDLIDDKRVLRDHTMGQVDYIHLLLPSHQVVWANGVSTESFHPASTDLGLIDPEQRARLEAAIPEVANDPHAYGPPARRELTRPEAAILQHEARVAH